MLLFECNKCANIVLVHHILAWYRGGGCDMQALLGPAKNYHGKLFTYFMFPALPSLYRCDIHCCRGDSLNRMVR